VSDSRPRFSAESLRQFTSQTFAHLGLRPADAEEAAEVLIDADLQGIESHGIAHLPWHFGYVPGLKQGLIKPVPEVRVLRDSPVSSTWDADSGLGVLVARRAMESCIEKAAASGLGTVAVRNGRHFGAAGYYAHMAAKRDMIGMAMCNVPAIAAAAGGLDRVYGTNPIAFGAPIEGERPFLLDMATTAVAGGKLEIAARQGKPIPQGWAVDASGESSDDPLVLRSGGALLPLGSRLETSSHKGYGLGLMVDILTGLLPGAGSALFNERHHQGYWFAAWRVDAFTDPSEFKVGMKRMADHIRETRPSSEADFVQIPGDPEWRARDDREERGIPLDAETLQQLRDLAAEIGARFPDQLPA